MASLDFQTPYLRTVLGFIGLRDVRTIAHIHNFDIEQNDRRLSTSKQAAIELVEAATGVAS